MSPAVDRPPAEHVDLVQELLEVLHHQRVLDAGVVDEGIRVIELAQLLPDRLLPVGELVEVLDVRAGRVLDFVLPLVPLAREVVGRLASRR